MLYAVRSAAFCALILLANALTQNARAQSSPPVAPAAGAPSKAAPLSPAAGYSVEDTPIGDLLDDPRARAILDKYIPGFSTGDQIDMARGMTLRGVQPYAPDAMTDDVLAKIQAELSKLPPLSTPKG